MLFPVVSGMTTLIETKVAGGSPNNGAAISGGAAKNLTGADNSGGTTLSTSTNNGWDKLGKFASVNIDGLRAEFKNAYKQATMKPVSLNTNGPSRFVNQNGFRTTVQSEPIFLHTFQINRQVADASHSHAMARKLPKGSWLILSQGLASNQRHFSSKEPHPLSRHNQTMAMMAEDIFQQPGKGPSEAVLPLRDGARYGQEYTFAGVRDKVYPEAGAIYVDAHISGAVRADFLQSATPARTAAPTVALVSRLRIRGLEDVCRKWEHAIVQTRFGKFKNDAEREGIAANLEKFKDETGQDYKTTEPGLFRRLMVAFTNDKEVHTALWDGSVARAEGSVKEAYNNPGPKTAANAARDAAMMLQKAHPFYLAYEPSVNNYGGPPRDRAIDLSEFNDHYPTWKGIGIDLCKEDEMSTYGYESMRRASAKAFDSLTSWEKGTTGQHVEAFVCGPQVQFLLKPMYA